MTVIVGLVGIDRDIYLGGDSAASKTSGSGRQCLIDTPKVFTPVHGPWYVMGGAGSFRMLQALKYSLKPPPPPGKNKDLLGFMSTHFVDAMRRCYKSTGILEQTSDGIDAVNGSVIVGYQGRMFEIDGDFQVITVTQDYLAIGSGDEIALGAMFATEGQPAGLRIETALKASASLTAYVREPFNILRLPFNKEWYQTTRKRNKIGKGK